MRRMLDKIIRPFGLRVIKARHAELVYQHSYAGGYEQYRAAQIEHNKRKLEDVWADNATLWAIADDLRRHGLGESGICHGARNGFEVTWLREHLGGEVIGTDISETATQFPHMQVWDFHEENPDWVERFDFVYTNSLDQAMEPARALNAWAKQIVPANRFLKFLRRQYPHIFAVVASSPLSRQMPQRSVFQEFPLLGEIVHFFRSAAPPEFIEQRSALGANIPPWPLVPQRSVPARRALAVAHPSPARAALPL